MLKEERLKYIMEKISRDNRVLVSDLSRELGVSDDTMRRDLTELEKSGNLTKVHGRAIAKSAIPLRFDERAGKGTTIKHRMVEKLVRRFADGDVILIDGGTSTLEVARSLPPEKHFTVFTNSLPLAVELSHHAGCETFMIGGTVFSPTLNTIGVGVLQSLQTIFPDWSIVGVSDIHPEKGLTTPDYEEAVIKRAMLMRGYRKAVLADASKLDTARAYHVASLREMDYIVTEDSKVEYIRNEWPQSGYEVI